jgi:hypothetical protein
LRKRRRPWRGSRLLRDAAPIELKARARRVSAWKQEANGIVGELPTSPVRTEAQAEQITLIPMGCARLRISAFPVVERRSSHIEAGSGLRGRLAPLLWAGATQPSAGPMGIP